MVQWRQKRQHGSPARAPCRVPGDSSQPPGQPSLRQGPCPAVGTGLQFGHDGAGRAFPGFSLGGRSCTLMKVYPESSWRCWGCRGRCPEGRRTLALGTRSKPYRGNRGLSPDERKPGGGAGTAGCQLCQCLLPARSAGGSQGRLGSWPAPPPLFGCGEAAPVRFSALPS